MNFILFHEQIHFYERGDYIMKSEKSSWVKRILIALVVVAIGLFSFLKVSKITSTVEFHKATIESIDEKKTTVTNMTTAALAASAAISALPGDTGSAIANELADLSSKCGIVLGALVFEKYMLPISGYIAFGGLIPLGCLLLAVGVLFPAGKKIIKWSVFAVILGIALFLFIPASVKISDIIETTYKDSVNSAITTADSTAASLGASAETSAESEPKKKGIISRIKGFFAGDDEKEGIVDRIKGGAADKIAKISKAYNDMLEGFIIMVITYCVIPIITLFLFIWIIRVLFHWLLGKTLPEYADAVASTRFIPEKAANVLKPRKHRSRSRREIAEKE